MRYSIYEENMERLTKKMIRIQNKCAKYGCEFHFAEVGEEFKEIETDEYDLETGEPIKEIRRFVIVEAEGKAIVNGWRFIASIDHTEKGNLINKAVDDVEVPERYYNNRPVCEHCGNKKVLHSFIVQNIETGEFKQVGRSCLKDFTFGMSAEGVAQYTAAFNELIEGEIPQDGASDRSRYYDVAELLKYAAETIRKFGYVKSDNADSTKSLVNSFYSVDAGWVRYWETLREIRNKMASVDFDANSEEAKKMVEDALAWLDEQEESNNYMHNLKVACGLKYTTWKNIGIIVSLFPTFNKDLEVQAKKKAEKEANKTSQYVGEIGKREDFEISDMQLISSWDTQWGTTWLYKFYDRSGNVLVWFASSIFGHWVDGHYIPEENVAKIKATVKDHNERDGVKQTIITRVKAIA